MRGDDLRARGRNPVKVAVDARLGAELVVHGRDFDEAREHCEQLAREHGYRYVHSGNEPLLIAGVGTATLEILEDAAATSTRSSSRSAAAAARPGLHRRQGGQTRRSR